MIMQVIQKIRITPENLGEIIKLPCFEQLTHASDGRWLLLVQADYLDGKKLNRGDWWIGVTATTGDTLAQYEDRTWEVRKTAEP